MTRLTSSEVVWRLVVAVLFAAAPVLLIVLAATGDAAWLWASLGLLGLIAAAGMVGALVGGGETE